MFLNLEISKLYEHLVIQMKDDDGDFLLIESALHLPKWCKPENMDNRVSKVDCTHLSLLHKAYESIVI